jgi:hypothetical protein
VCLFRGWQIHVAEREESIIMPLKLYLTHIFVVSEEKIEWFDCAVCTVEVVR